MIGLNVAGTSPFACIQLSICAQATWILRQTMVICLATLSIRRIPFHTRLFFHVRSGRPVASNVHDHCSQHRLPRLHFVVAHAQDFNPILGQEASTPHSRSCFGGKLLLSYRTHRQVSLAPALAMLSSLPICLSIHLSR
jgi:hypothetical protein